MSGVKRAKLFRILLTIFFVYALATTALGVLLLNTGENKAVALVIIAGSYAPLFASLVFWLFVHDWHKHEDVSTGKLRKTLEAEELQSEAVLTALDEGVLIMNRGGVVKYMNPRMEQMMASTEQYMVGKHFSKLVSEDLSIVSSSAKQPRLSYNVMQVFETGKAVQIERERLLYHKSGTYLDVMISLLPLINQQGQVSALMIVGRDISSLVRVQEKTEEFVVQAGQRFSETLRPVVEAAAQVSLGPDASDQTKESFARMQQSLGNLKQFTSDVTTYTSLMQDKVKKEFKFVKVADVFVAATNRAKENHANKYVTVTHDVAVPSVIVDEARFQLVIDQLVDNAYKFSPDKDIVLVRAVADGTTAVIEVADNGVGITEEQRETIFEPFVKEYDQGQQDSTGLGMSICKKIVDDWGGEIKISTQESGGVVVTCTLPGAIEAAQGGEDDAIMAPHLQSAMNAELNA